MLSYGIMNIAKEENIYGRIYRNRKKSSSCIRISRKGQYFTRSNYQDIRKVYSIWIVLSPNKGKNTVTKYEESPECLYGNYTEPDSDNTLSSIIIIRLGKSQSADGALEMLNILTTHMNPSEKLKKLENFGLKITRELKKEVEDMCDWTNAFTSRALEQGLEQGMNKAKKEMVLNLLRLGEISVEKIASVAEMSVEDIRLLQKELYH